MTFISLEISPWKLSTLVGWVTQIIKMFELYMENLWNSKTWDSEEKSVLGVGVGTGKGLIWQFIWKVFVFWRDKHFIMWQISWGFATCLPHTFCSIHSSFVVFTTIIFSLFTLYKFPSSGRLDSSLQIIINMIVFKFSYSPESLN